MDKIACTYIFNNETILVFLKMQTYITVFNQFVFIVT